MTLPNFCGLFCVVFVIDGLLTFLDFLITQGDVIRMIIRRAHAAHVPGPRKRTVLELTLVKQGGLDGMDCLE